MTSEAVAAGLEHVNAVAVIDDGLQPFAMTQVPENERVAVLALLDDAELLLELKDRGFDAEGARAAPDEAIDSLTSPDGALGIGFQKLTEVSDALSLILERRHTMRQIAATMRVTGKCEVVERGPDDDLNDIARFDIIFLDYYLDSTDVDGQRAEAIAADIHARREITRNQQVVLMSSRPGVRDLRAAFRKKAEIEGASFAFVAKKDLDEPWKVRAHLEMLSRAMPFAGALGAYVGAVKTNVEAARNELSAAIDDLDIGDFAYIQRVALNPDGHPLGDYLSWLLSSHLTALAFEGPLRDQQRAVDAMEFKDGPLSPAEPSIGVANLYHDALFARNLGRVEAHPRAQPGSEFEDVPLVQLGDVFLDAARTKAVVVLSADCDLAFSTVVERAPDRDRAVILVSGRPSSIKSEPTKPGHAHTEGMVSGGDVYRIDWDFDTFRTVSLGDLVAHLTNLGLDLSNRDRLRPLYSLKLQQEFGSNLMRVGPPIMPPISRRLRASIQRDSNGAIVQESLDPGEVVVARFGKTLALRMTPSLVGKLKNACRELHFDMKDHLATLPAEGDKTTVKLFQEWSAKTTALGNQIENDTIWMELLKDIPVPPSGEIKRIRGCISFARGTGWQFPSQPMVVLALAENEGSDAPASIDDADA